MVKLVEMNHAILWEPYAATPSEVLVQNLLYTALNLKQFSSLNTGFLYFFRDSPRLFSIQRTMECGFSSILNYLKKRLLLVSYALFITCYNTERLSTLPSIQLILVWEDLFLKH